MRSLDMGLVVGSVMWMVMGSSELSPPLTTTRVGIEQDQDFFISIKCKVKLLQKFPQPGWK